MPASKSAAAVRGRAAAAAAAATRTSLATRGLTDAPAAPAGKVVAAVGKPPKKPEETKRPLSQAEALEKARASNSVTAKETSRGRASLDEATGQTGVKHRSNAQELAEKIPVKLVKSTFAACDGGGGALGHPVVYIQLNTRKPHDVVVCKYCSARFQMDPHFHGTAGGH